MDNAERFKLQDREGVEEKEQGRCYGFGPLRRVKCACFPSFFPSSYRAGLQTMKGRRQLGGS